MKKFFYTMIAAACMTSCINEDWNEVAQGRISVNLDTNVSVTTRATSTESAPAANDFYITITKSGESTAAFNNKLSELSSQTFAAGEYSITACSESAAPTFGTSEWGKAWFATAAPVSVTVHPNTEETANVTMSMANAKASATFSTDFDYAYKDYSIKIFKTNDASREFTFPATGHEAAYFNLDASTVTENKNKLEYELTYYAKEEGAAKQTKTGSCTLEAAHWYKFNVGTGTDGKINITLNIVDTVTDDVKDVIVDPYGN